MGRKTIKIICNHAEPKEISDRLEKYIIKSKHDLEINLENPDYYVIVNNPYYKGKKQYYNPEKTLYFYNEPKSTRLKWKSWGETENFNNNKIPIWTAREDIETFYNKKIIKDELKRKTISCITSDLFKLNGHKLRVKFLKYFDQLNKFNITPEIYGQSKTGMYNKLELKHYYGKIKNRLDAIDSYYYNFMAENTEEIGYFTEKIIDPILSETLCFYWGCPNLKNYIDERSYIKIDLERPLVAMKTIADSINNNEYEKRLKYIKESKRKIIYELNPMTFIDNHIKQLHK